MVVEQCCGGGCADTAWVIIEWAGCSNPRKTLPELAGHGHSARDTPSRSSSGTVFVQPRTIGDLGHPRPDEQLNVAFLARDDRGWLDQASAVSRLQYTRQFPLRCCATPNGRHAPVCRLLGRPRLLCEAISRSFVP